MSAHDQSTATHRDRLAHWIDTVRDRCGGVRVCLATGLAEAADPADLTVHVGRDAYGARLGRRCAIQSYGGFRRALDFLVRDGVLDPTDHPDRYRLTVSA